MTTENQGPDVQPSAAKTEQTSPESEKRYSDPLNNYLREALHLDPDEFKIEYVGMEAEKDAETGKEEQYEVRSDNYHDILEWKNDLPPAEQAATVFRIESPVLFECLNNGDEKDEIYKNRDRILSLIKELSLGKHPDLYAIELERESATEPVAEEAPKPIIFKPVIEVKKKEKKEEAGKIYENPSEDPAVIALKLEITNSVKRTIGKINPTAEEWNAAIGPASRTAWDKFVSENPEKAAAYRGKFGAITEALDRAEGKSAVPEIADDKAKAAETGAKPTEVKLYENPAEDPAIAALKDEITKATQRAVGNISPEPDEWSATFGPVSRAAWEKFVLENPEKADAYRNKYGVIGDTFARIEKKKAEEAEWRGADLGKITEQAENLRTRLEELKGQNKWPGFENAVRTLLRDIEEAQKELLSPSLSEEEKRKKFGTKKFKDFIDHSNKMVEAWPNLHGIKAAPHGEVTESEAEPSEGKELAPTEIAEVAAEEAEKVLADPVAVAAAVEAAIPAASEEEKENLAKELQTEESTSRFTAKIKKYITEKGGWMSLAGGVVSGGAARMLIKKSFRYALGSNLAVGIAAGAVAGAAVGFGKELWEEKRKFRAGSVIDQFDAAETDEEKALVYAKINDLYEKKKISGDEEELAVVAEELRAAKTLLDAKKETAGLEGKDKIVAILKIAEKNAEDISKTEKKDIKKLIKGITLERGPAEWKKLGGAALRGAVIGAFGGAIGGAITGFISDHIGAESDAVESAVKKGAAIVAEEKAGATAEKGVAAVAVLGPEANGAVEKSFAAANAMAKKNVGEMLGEIMRRDFAVEVQQGDGLTHVARKGIHDLVANFSKLGIVNDFPPEKMVYAEDWLQKNLADVGVANLRPGEHIAIPAERIYEALEKADMLSDKQIENLSGIVRSSLSSETIEFMKNEGATLASGENNFYEGAIGHLTSDEVVEEVKEAAAGALREAHEGAVSATAEAAAEAPKEMVVEAGEVVAKEGSKALGREVAGEKTGSVAEKIALAVGGTVLSIGGGIYGGRFWGMLLDDLAERREVKRLKSEKVITSDEVQALVTKIRSESGISLSVADDMGITALDAVSFEKSVAEIKEVVKDVRGLKISMRGLTRQKPRILASGEIEVDKKYLGDVAGWLAGKGRIEQISERMIKRQEAIKEQESFNAENPSLPQISFPDDMIIGAEEIKRIAATVKKAITEGGFAPGDLPNSIIVYNHFSNLRREHLLIKKGASEKKIVEFIKKNSNKNG
ncbi:MAG: hypothetical protein LiPW15_774 [Parcubacteria group bacterium LiPW_15]|nr:MAG: hypothetical protein LiPW15_774 [Parcubacteria group bacterium LiPW_15]